ncbi:MAG: peptide deformylase [Planctomycetes bacterium]|nr:peptide deformylase [Planctomycetota bacterium]
MILEVRKWPDPVLLKSAEPVTEFDSRLKHFVEDMFETMYAEKGVGLAAPQVGESKRIFVVNCSFEEDGVDGEIALINPEIVATDEEYMAEEGCLSFPGVRAKVKRYHRATIKFQDVKGKWHEIEGEELLAQAFQHELDHLNGKVFIDFLDEAQLASIRKELEALKREFKRRQPSALAR